MNIKITRLRNIINFADIIMVHNLWSKTIMKIILKAFLRQLPISASNFESFEKWFKRVLEFKAWIFLPVQMLDSRRPAKNRRTGTTPNFESQLVTPKPEALLENYPCESFLVWSQFSHFFNTSLVISCLGSLLDKTGKCGLMITDYSSVVFN